MVAPGSASTLLSPTSYRIAPTPQVSHLDDALGPHAVTSTANVPPAPNSCRITAGPAGRQPRWRRSRRAAGPGRPAGRRRRPAEGSTPARPVSRRGDAVARARRHQAGQHAPSADQLQDHHRPGRLVAAVVKIEARAVTSPASRSPAPISSRITAGTDGRPPRRCRSSSRTPAAGPPARRWRRSDAGSALACADGRRGGAAGRTSARSWMPHYANATA